MRHYLARTLTLFALACCSSLALGAWSFAGDFSAANNPNGAWSYGSSTSIGGFSLFTDNASVSNWYATHGGSAGIAGWCFGSPPAPLIAKNFTASTYYQTWNPGDVLVGPGQTNQLAIARWTRQDPGWAAVTFSGSFRRMENATSNISNYYAALNGAVLDSGSLVLLNETHPFSFTLGMNLADKLDLIVGYTSTGSGAGGTGLVTNETVTVDPTQFVLQPQTVSVGPGMVLGGGLAHILASDDVFLIARPGAVFSVATPPLQIVFEATSPTEAIHRIQFAAESAGTNVNLEQRIQIYDFVAAGYVELQARPMTLTDSISIVRLCG